MSTMRYYFKASDIEVMFNDDCTYPGKDLLDEGGITLVAGDGEMIIYLEAIPDDLKKLAVKLEAFLKENEL